MKAFFYRSNFISKEVVADLLGGVPGDPCRETVGRHVAEDGEDGADEHESAGREDHFPAAGGDDVVDDGGEEHGEEEIHDRPAEFDGEAQHHLRKEWPDVGEDMLQCGVLLSGIFLIIAQIFRNGKDSLKKDL